MSVYPKIGSVCTSCKIGRLKIVTVSKQSGTTSRGIIGMKLFAEFIERLACDNCHLSYETDLRGQTPDGYIESQTKVGGKDRTDELLKAKRPVACPSCAGTTFTTHEIVPREERMFLDGPDFDERRKRERGFVCCKTCLTLVKIQRSEHDKDMTKLGRHFRQAMSKKQAAKIVSSALAKQKKDASRRA